MKIQEKPFEVLFRTLWGIPNLKGTDAVEIPDVCYNKENLGTDQVLKCVLSFLLHLLKEI